MTTSMSVHSQTEVAPYTLLEKEGVFELRHYEKLTIVSTPVYIEGQKTNSFAKLFNYISGNNNQSQKISMTAPVFTGQLNEESGVMSFVLPSGMTLRDAPLPKDPTLNLQELTDYRVATITFNGRLQTNNIQKHLQLLEDWIEHKKLIRVGNVKTAGYNSPYTLPAFRRNEVLIQVQKPDGL